MLNVLNDIDPEAFFTVFVIICIAAFSAIVTVRFIVRQHRKEIKTQIDKGFEDIKNRIIKT